MAHVCASAQTAAEGVIMEEFLTNEQLQIFLHNQELITENLRDRLFKLTGCKDFGNIDGMNGACIECSYEDEELFNRCWKFKFNN